MSSRAAVRPGWPAAVRGLVRACHPGPTAGVTAVTALLAAARGVPAGPAATAVAAVLAGQLSIGWCNDAVDAARDAAAGRWTKPLAGAGVGSRLVLAAAIAAAAVCLPLSLACGALAGVVHLGGVAVGWLYNLGAKATTWSWATYAVGFAALVTFLWLLRPTPGPPWWPPLVAALLGVGGHLANALPDLDEDVRTGVRGLPQRLGAARVRRVAVWPPLAAAGVLAGVTAVGGSAAAAAAGAAAAGAAAAAPTVAGMAAAGHGSPRAGAEAPPGVVVRRVTAVSAVDIVWLAALWMGQRGR